MSPSADPGVLRHLLKTGPQKTSVASGWCEVSSSREPGGDGRLRLVVHYQLP
ncbi:hypothetical protein C8F04DRAFT_1249123 [Mycena alexandri]|uniref:Uncharacterized protein n=1 Tax=Mycena alexandri TaxID=1745969 RepID=A0AAD6XF64_9AGAR|nr:hypothetical protein C8F04DRAFT_1249123 [Mycena alexandri]